MTDIKPFIELLEVHKLTRLEYQEGDLRIELERRPVDGFLQSQTAAVNVGTVSPEVSREIGNTLEVSAATVFNATGTSPDALLDPSRDPSRDALTSDSNDTIVTAPLVGMAYRSSEPGAVPFIEVGQRVEQGDALCLIEAMKLFNEIPSPQAGTIKKILFEDGALVEYNAPLIVIG